MLRNTIFFMKIEKEHKKTEWKCERDGEWEWVSERTKVWNEVGGFGLVGGVFDNVDIMEQWTV